MAARADNAPQALERERSPASRSLFRTSPSPERVRVVEPRLAEELAAGESPIAARPEPRSRTVEDLVQVAVRPCGSCSRSTERRRRRKHGALVGRLGDRPLRAQGTSVSRASPAQLRHPAAPEQRLAATAVAAHRRPATASAAGSWAAAGGDQIRRAPDRSDEPTAPRRAAPEQGDGGERQRLPRPPRALPARTRAGGAGRPRCRRPRTARRRRRA